MKVGYFLSEPPTRLPEGTSALNCIKHQTLIRPRFNESDCGGGGGLYLDGGVGVGRAGGEGAVLSSVGVESGGRGGGQLRVQVS